MPTLGYFTLLFILTLRYLLVAGGAFLIFWIWKPKWVAPRRIQQRLPHPEVIRREILWSFSTSLIFAAAGRLLFWAKENGHTLIYESVSDYGWWYLFLSILFYMILHDTYFYWTHRWMHTKTLFKWFHQVHHDSRVPSPLAAFSFHPLEALVEAAILPLLAFLFPIHIGAFLAFLTIMTFLSVINHLGYEIYPKGFPDHWLTRWIISATHHDHHHQSYGHNLGLYFTWWDHWMKTQDLEYSKRFAQITNGSMEATLQKAA